MVEADPWTDTQPRSCARDAHGRRREGREVEERDGPIRLEAGRGARVRHADDADGFRIALVTKTGHQPELEPLPQIGVTVLEEGGEGESPAWRHVTGSRAEA